MYHQFDIEIAKQYGVNAAILYNNFQFWIAENKANGRNFKDNLTWTYNSTRAYADLIPYLSLWDIRRAIKRLVDAGILLKANHNAKGYDRTAWYAFKDEKTSLSGLPAHLWNSQMECAKSTNGFVNSTHLYQIQKPNSKPDKNNKVEFSPEERLRLDLVIADKNRIFMQTIEQVFRPSKREAKTFASIARFLVRKCQQRELNPSVFNDAIEWAKQAKFSNAVNKKGLFVAKIKQETGFHSQGQILKKVT